MRRIGCVSVARSDYGIYRPVLDAIQKHPKLELGVIVAAAHLSPRFGMTERDVERDGYPIVGRVEMLLDGDSPASLARSSGLGTLQFANVIEQTSFDLIVILGDRFEMLAAATAVVPFLIPIAHLHGGEETTGAIDNLYRHAITKLSQYHFVSTEANGSRVRQMGESSDRVWVTGAPAIDRIMSVPKLSRNDVAQRLGLELPDPYLIATFHPVTTQFSEAQTQARNFLEALDQLQIPTILTMPNADTGGTAVRQAIADFSSRSWLHPFENLGSDLYVSVMSHALAMVGNSSSGIIEAASLHLPVVNIGTRQLGRERSGNVIDVTPDIDEIVHGVRTAASDEFRRTCASIRNIYGEGNAGQRIADILAQVPIGPKASMKPFEWHR